MIKSYKDLEVYNLAYAIAMDVFQITRKFPKEEIYSLSSQVIRSSRSISANIVEGWAKRVYENKFKVHLVDSLGSTAETVNWIPFAKDCGYISAEQFNSFNERLETIGKMLTKLHQNWRSPNPQTSNLETPTSNL